MSNTNIKESEKNIKQLFSLLGKKTEPPNHLCNIIDEPKQEEKNQCQICKKKYNLFQCIICLSYYCSKCIKLSEYYQNRRIKRNEFICQNCTDNEDFQTKGENFQNYFCFICSEYIGENNKHNYLVTKRQKIQFQNEIFKKFMAFQEANKDTKKEESEYCVIRICFKCHLTYSKVIDKILNENINDEKNDKKAINNKMIGTDILNNLKEMNENNFINFPKNLKNIQEIKNDVIENEKESKLNKENEINSINNSNINKEEDNLLELKKIFENNSLFRDFKSSVNNLNNVNNRDIIKNNNNQNEFLNKNLNFPKENNSNLNYINIDNPMTDNRNNNIKMSDLYKLLNLNNPQNINNNSNLLNNFTNLFNNINANPSLIPNLPLNNGSGNNFSNNNIFSSLSLNNNLGNNIFNFDSSLNNNNNLNNNQNKINELYEFPEKERNVNEKVNENKNKDINPEEYSIDPDNIYFCLYRMKDVLNQFTKYLSIFENNNMEYNNSILENIESLIKIFSTVIIKIKTELQNNKEYQMKFNLNQNDNKENNENINNKEDGNNKDKKIEKDKHNNSININTINKNNEFIDKNIKELKGNNDIKTENYKGKSKINDDDEKNILIIKKENNINKEKEEFENKSNENEEEVEEPYEYYLDLILNINESFKNKLKAMKIYNDLKNLFFTILFKNIERLILKLSDVAEETQNKKQTQNSKNQPKIEQNLHNNLNINNANNITNSNNLNNNRFSFENISQLNALTNLLSQSQNNNSIFNQIMPPLINLQNFNCNQQPYMPKISPILQNNNINRDLQILKNKNEIKYPGNIPNIFNINQQQSLNKDQRGLGINSLILQSIKNQSYFDKNNNI